jgi:hypothetical protein
MSKRAHKSPLPVIGQTHEGRLLVVNGVYALYETHGLPFDVIFGALKDRGLIPSWLHVYRDARKAGIAHDRLLGQLDPAIVDSYGTTFRDGILKTLGQLKSLTIEQIGKVILGTGG